MWKSKWVALLILPLAVSIATSIWAAPANVDEARGSGKGEGVAIAAFQGAISVSSGVWVYQLTESGLALELTAKGTKYYKDDDLS